MYFNVEIVKIQKEPRNTTTKDKRQKTKDRRQKTKDKRQTESLQNIADVFISTLKYPRFDHEKDRRVCEILCCVMSMLK